VTQTSTVGPRRGVELSNLEFANNPLRTGRALAILPREIAEHGYQDMEIDDDKDEGFIKDLLEKINNVSVMVKK